MSKQRDGRSDKSYGAVDPYVLQKALNRVLADQDLGPGVVPTPQQQVAGGLTSEHLKALEDAAAYSSL